MEVAEEGRLTLDPPLVVEDGSRRGRLTLDPPLEVEEGRLTLDLPLEVEKGRLTLDPPLEVEDGSCRGRKANLGSTPSGRGWKSQRKEG